MKSGTFLTRDPVWPVLDDPRLNPYQYAHQSPLQHTDPSGNDVVMGTWVELDGKRVCVRPEAGGARNDVPVCVFEPLAGEDTSPVHILRIAG